MYRKRQRGSRKMMAMRAARAAGRRAGGSLVPVRVLPELRRTIIVIDYDFGRVEHRIDLYRTDRIDCYRAVADGRPWQQRIGWSRVLAGIRKGFLRVSAMA